MHWGGFSTLEMITRAWKCLEMITRRARTQLILILVKSDDDRYKDSYKKKHFQDAAAKGLVELASI